MIPESSTAGLVFLRDATHSGMIDNLSATFLGVYAIDQIDVTDRLKVRLSIRQDWWDEQLDPRAYKGFKGTVEQTGLTTYNIIGKCEIIDDNRCIITELPIGGEIDSYVKFLHSIKAPHSHLLKSVSGTKLPLTVKFLDGKLQELIDTNTLYKKLRLIIKISTNNMYAYDPQSKLKKYNSAEDILSEYYHFRLKMYTERIELSILSLKHKLNLIANKIKFVDCILNGRLDFRSNMLQWLIAYDFPQLSIKINQIPSYRYLLEISVYDLTESFIDKLKDKYEQVRSDYEMYIHTTPKQLWLNELNKFENAYQISEKIDK